jgi:hypothetical protein
LAVFDESWYTLAGLAESLSVEVVMAPAATGTNAAPPPKGGDYSEHLEIGFDPIVSAEKWDKGMLVAFSPSAAIGFSFDTGTDAPFFNSASFLIQSSLRLKPWTFVKLRFRRDIVDLPPPASAPVSSALGSASEQAKAQSGIIGQSDPPTSFVPVQGTQDELNAAWTPGHWIQILPDAAWFETTAGTSIAAKDLKLNVASIGGSSSLTFSLLPAGSTSAAVLQPTQVDKTATKMFVVFELWLVVTRTIRATGAESGVSVNAPEAYILTVPLDPNTGVATLPGMANPFGDGATSADWCVRIVEVQRRIQKSASTTQSAHLAVGSPDPLWDDIFPTDVEGIPSEPVARIVRVSDPIGIAGRRWSGDPT